MESRGGGKPEKPGDIAGANEGTTSRAARKEGCSFAEASFPLLSPTQIMRKAISQAIFEVESVADLTGFLTAPDKASVLRSLRKSSLFLAVALESIALIERESFSGPSLFS